MSDRINRREFIKRGAATGAGAGLTLGMSRRAGAAFDNTDSPNGRVTLGFIGTGARAHQVLDDVMKVPGFEVVALCDAYKGRLDHAVEMTKGRAKPYKDHHELLTASGLDAVEIIAAVKKTGRILQVGSQNISSPAQIKAREIVASGRLGQITMIRATVNRNTAGGAWIYPIPPDADPETVNWEMFLGSAPKRPFSLERFFRWRCYEDYSGGMATDLFVHVMTTIHFVMGAQAPDMVMAAGSLYRWKESRDVPDTLDAIMQYPEGFTVNLSGTFNNQSAGERGIQILGVKGTLTLGRDLVFTPDNPIEDNGWIVDSWPSELQKAYYNDPKVIAAEMPQRWDPKVVEGEERWGGVGRNSVMLHFENFQKAIRERKQPVEDVYAGHRAAAVAHMVNLSAKNKKQVFWDRSRDNVKA